jgi:hypothetical protein
MAGSRMVALGLLALVAFGCGRATVGPGGAQPTARIAVPVTRSPTVTSCPGEIPVPPPNLYVQVFSTSTTSVTVPLGGYLLVVLSQGEGAIPPDGSFAWVRVTNSYASALVQVTEPGLCPGKSYASSLPMARYAYRATSVGTALLTATLTSACENYQPCKTLGALHMTVTVK